MEFDNKIVLAVLKKLDKSDKSKKLTEKKLTERRNRCMEFRSKLIISLMNELKVDSYLIYHNDCINCKKWWENVQRQIKTKFDKR